MNRLKLWAFALLVLAAGAVNLHLSTQWLAHDAVADADRALRAAAGQLDARSQLLAAQAAALADAAARAPAVLAALAEAGDGDPTAAATLALAAASRGAGPEAARGLLVGTVGPDGAALRRAGKPVELQDPPGGLFAEPLRGARREGYARVSDGVWFVAAVPAGKGAVAVGLPVGTDWAYALHEAAGAEVVLAAGQTRPIATLSGADLAAVASASRTAQPGPVDAGSLGRVRTSLPGAPSLPLLLGRLPAYRVQAVALRGMKAGLVALAVPMAPAAAPLVTYQVVSLGTLLLLLAAGLFLGLLVTPELPASVPRELVTAADRIGRGDFAARVPALAGSLGTVAAALNRAAEAAGGGGAAPPGRAEIDGASAELFAPAAGAEADPFAFPVRPPPPRPAPEPPPAPPPELAPEPTGPDLFAPQPAAPPPASLEPLNNSVSGATSLTTRPEDLLPGGPAAPPAAPAAEPEEAHWREVFDEFLRVREACGESNEGLSFDRFEAKLRTNRAALIQKHACRTVRFQVYVKDGRAALKATPLR